MPYVLVTGASTGIGRATALRLARNGFEVFAGVRDEAAGERLRAEDRHVTPVRLDVTDAGEIAAAAAEIERAAGRLDGLVNNAGVGTAAPVEYLSPDTLRRTYEVNVFGQVAVTQAMLPLLRRAHGRVVTIGSIGDRMAIPFGGALASSKFAIAALNDALRMELRPWGIGVVLVEPATIHTDAVDKLEREADEALEAMGPEGRALYGDRLRTMVATFARTERDGSPPDVVARTVAHALTVRTPRTRYLTGKDSLRMATMARWAPPRLLDRLRLRVFGLPD